MVHLAEEELDVRTGGRLPFHEEQVLFLGKNALFLFCFALFFVFLLLPHGKECVAEPSSS